MGSDMEKATAFVLWPWVWLILVFCWFFGFVAHAACRLSSRWHAGQAADVFDHFGAGPVATDRVVGGVQPFEHVFLVGMQPTVAHRVLVPFTDTQVGEFYDGVVQRVELVRQRGQVNLPVQFFDALNEFVHVHGRVTPVETVEQPCGDTACADTGRQPRQRGEALDIQKFSSPSLPQIEIKTRSQFPWAGLPGLRVAWPRKPRMGDVAILIERVQAFPILRAVAADLLQHERAVVKPDGMITN